MRESGLNTYTTDTTTETLEPGFDFIFSLSVSNALKYIY